MIRTAILLSLFTGCIALAQAQSKQEIYCNPDIVWAGIIDIDIAPDAPKNQNWDLFQKIGLSNLQFKQKDSTLKENSQTLADFIIKKAHKKALVFYNQDSLKESKKNEDLELHRVSINEKETGNSFASNEFEIFKLRCFIYFNQKDFNFRIIPQAVAVVRTEYDLPDSAPFYHNLGWLPIGELKDSDLSNTNWAKRFYRDIRLEDVQIFKQELRTPKLFENIISIIHNKKKSTLKSPIDLNGNTPLSNEQYNEIGMEDQIDIDDDGNEKVVSMHFDYDNFTGINFAFDLSWDDKKNQLLFKQKTYSPIFQYLYMIWEEKDEKKLHYAFTKKVD